MGILTFLDLLLGLFFVFMVFALIASAVNEAVAAVWDSRARWLRRGLGRLLAQTDLIKVLESPHLLLPESSKRAASKDQNAPSYIRGPDLLRAVLDAAAAGKPAGPWDMDYVRDRLAHLDESSPIKTILLDLAREANGNVEAFRQAYERWYSEFEQTLRGWYRRKTHLVLLLISFVLAMTFNVDAIRLMRHLSTDADTRQALAAMAVEATQDDEASELPASTAVREASKKLVELQQQPDPDTAAIDAADQALQKALAELRVEALKQVEALEASGLQLGWDAASFSQAEKYGCAYWWDWLCALFLALPGLLISAFAFTLGAPFWFDLLKQIASVRSVGRAPAEVKQVETQTPMA